MVSSTRISDLLKPGDVALDLTVPSKPWLLQWLADKASEALGIDSDRIRDALMNRESLGSTGIGQGVAIPHAPIADIAAPFGLLVRLRKPLDFEAIDDHPVDIVFLLLTPTENKGEHLKALAAIAKRLRVPDVMKNMRSVSDKEQLYSAIAGENC